MIDLSIPPIRIDDAEGWWLECARLEAEIEDRVEAGEPVPERLASGLMYRVTMLEACTNESP